MVCDSVNKSLRYAEGTGIVRRKAKVVGRDAERVPTVFTLPLVARVLEIVLADHAAHRAGNFIASAPSAVP